MMRYCQRHRGMELAEEGICEVAGALLLVNVSSPCVLVDRLVVEKVDGAWPEWATSQSAFRTQTMGDGYPSLVPRTMAEILDALAEASQVGESGR